MKLLNYKSDSFFEFVNKILSEYSWKNLQQNILDISVSDVETTLSKQELSLDDFMVLVSPAAGGFLEDMAQKSHKLTLQRFGKTVLMYAPLYVSNFCTNSCVYCGFNVNNKIRRVSLTVDEAVDESMYLYEMGFRHILLVSGEHPDYANVDYLCELSEKLRHKFSSICVEVQPLTRDDYTQLISSGVDCVTCYQETYSKETYPAVHPGGRKSDYKWRIGTVERAAQAGIRKIGISPLYGLDDWHIEALFTAYHAWYIMTNYWKTQVSISFPRLRHAAGEYAPPYPLDNKGLAQLICAFRLTLPDVHLVLSTREQDNIRDKMLPLGITQMSAASSTSPLGYSHRDDAGDQFDVMDSRSASEVAEAIKKTGYEPVWKDWDREFLYFGF